MYDFFLYYDILEMLCNSIVIYSSIIRVLSLRAIDNAKVIIV